MTSPESETQFLLELLEIIGVDMNLQRSEYAERLHSKTKLLENQIKLNMKLEPRTASLQNIMDSFWRNEVFSVKNLA